jgi:hypothetical protein
MRIWRNYSRRTTEINIQEKVSRESQMPDEKILLVDDEDSNLRLLTYMMR